MIKKTEGKQNSLEVKVCAAKFNPLSPQGGRRKHMLGGLSSEIHNGTWHLDSTRTHTCAHLTNQINKCKKKNHLDIKNLNFARW